MSRTEPVRVLHVIQNLHYGGQERIIADLVRGIDRDRFEPHILALQFAGRFSEGLGEIAEIHIGDSMSRLAMIRPATLARQIARIAPDVVHSHSSVWFKVATAARMAGVPRVVQTDHGRTFPVAAVSRVLDALAIGKTDVIVAVSEKLAGELEKSNPRFGPSMMVIENGVDTEQYRPRAADGRIREELSLAPDVPIIGSVGRLEHVKGFDVAVDALSILRKGWDGPGPPPVLVVAGDGRERQEIEEQMRNLGVEDAVHLLSWRDDLPDLHASYTIFTMTSRSEGTSVSLLESMSAGLCPVVTDVGGNRAVLGSALEHRLVPSEDPQAIAGAWKDALSDPERLAADSDAARSIVVDGFSLAHMVARYEQVYLGDSSGA